MARHQEAFANFAVDKVARFQEPDIEALLANPDSVRNMPKIRAVVANAAAFQAIAKEHGSFARCRAELRWRAAKLDCVMQ